MYKFIYNLANLKFTPGYEYKYTTRIFPQSLMSFWLRMAQTYKLIIMPGVELIPLPMVRAKRMQSLKNFPRCVIEGRLIWSNRYLCARFNCLDVFLPSHHLVTCQNGDWQPIVLLYSRAGPNGRHDFTGRIAGRCYLPLISGQSKLA